MTHSDLQRQVVETLSPKPTVLRDDIIAFRYFEKAPVTIYSRFLGERAASAFVKNPHDQQLVIDFLDEVSDQDLDAVSETHPVALRASDVTKQLGFDTCVVVHPRVAEAPTTLQVKFMQPHTFLTFPAYECDVTRTDTMDEARFRLTKVLDYSDWRRAPAPAVSARYAERATGVKTTGGKRLGVFRPAELERALHRIIEGGGFMEAENFKREVVTIRVEDEVVELVHPGGSRPVPRNEILGWYRAFLLKGLEAAEAASVKELERLVRFAYGSLAHAERGGLARDTLAELGKALGSAGECLPVAAAWTAAQVAMLPQLQDAFLATGIVAVQEVAQRVADPTANAHMGSHGASALRAMLTKQASDPLAARRASAAQCLVSALECCLQPNPALFADTVEQWALATRDPADGVEAERVRWTAWLDDVVTRADRFSTAEMLAQLDSTLQGTIRGLLPSRYTWEGTADDKSTLQAWTRDPATNKLVMPVLTLSSVTLSNDVLHVVVASQPNLVKDRLRIEHLFEHEVHRRFMDSTYSGRYQVIEYEFEAGRDRWRAPV